MKITQPMVVMMMGDLEMPYGGSEVYQDITLQGVFSLTESYPILQISKARLSVGANTRIAEELYRKMFIAGKVTVTVEIDEPVKPNGEAALS